MPVENFKLDDDDIPEDWRVLWCFGCASSIAWEKSVEGDLLWTNDWWDALQMAIDESEHNLELHRERDGL